MKGLRALCREFGILYVSDEVITAFGRIGAWFASEMWELDPDIICVAKGITSGYLPLGGTMVSDEIAEPLLKGGYFAHGFTYSGHPSCCAAALANLQYIEDHGLVEKVKDDLGPYFEAKLASLASHPAVSEVRAFGLIGAAELVPKGGRDALTPTSLLGAKGFQSHPGRGRHGSRYTRPDRHLTSARYFAGADRQPVCQCRARFG